MEFLASDIDTILKLKRNRLQAWIEKKYIKPSIEEATGPGTRNKWSIYDLYTLSMFKKITEAGMSRQLVADILKEGGFDIENISPDMLKKLRHRIFFLDGGKVKIAIVIGYEKGKPSKIDIDKLAKQLHVGDFDMAIVVNLQRIFNEVDIAVKEWEKTR